MDPCSLGLVPLSEMGAELAGAARGVPLHARDGSIRAFAMVDAEDYERVSAYRWYMKVDRYVRRSAPKPDGRSQWSQYLHRFILGIDFDGRHRKVDHINHDPLDNRKTNLRACSHQENMQNHRAWRNASSRYRGVSFRRNLGKWHAYGRLNGRPVHLGFYVREEEAAEVARQFRREHMPFSID